MLAQIWADVLGMERIALEDDFVDLGGNSLAALRIIARVYEATGIKMPVRAMFDNLTVASMAVRLKELRGTDAGD